LKKLIVFDLDGTLVESKASLDMENGEPTHCFSGW
jgi:hydroxymethylpyrimidine pyrophosphatase-like HAD family hydrolase